jgi:hypothetical protein
MMAQIGANYSPSTADAGGHELAAALQIRSDRHH